MFIAVCDLCGKPLVLSYARIFKVKEYGRNPFQNSWKGIEIHDRCVKKLLENIMDEEEIEKESSSQVTVK